MHVTLSLDPPATTRAIALRIASALGGATRAEIDVSAPEPLDCEALTGTPARIEIGGDDGATAVHHGIVAGITASATVDPGAQRLYTLDVRSAIEWLTLRKDARVFRKTTAAAIVEELLAGVGVRDDAFVNEAEPPPEREHVTQWNETDAVFLRRICEEEGLFFRFDPKEGFDAFVLCDRSDAAPDGLSDPLMFVDESGLVPGQRVAFAARQIRRRRPGKVALRDHDPARPAVKLEAKAEGGLEPEKAVEVYQAPGRFRTDGEGQREATLRLEALRADADVLEFDTTALELRPGVQFEADATLAVGPAPSGKYFVVETSLTWRAGEPEGRMSVKAIPLGVPYRLPRATPRPRVPGILSATVTGASGEEIHTDAAGCVRVTFPWDRGGPKDETASLPVRVMQAHLPGSMLVPRVGWEVLVGFEDGDPDRPYVLGRSFNGRQLPAFGLPANKTMTAFGTVSSPGGGKANMITLEDAAGRQHMVWNAGFGKTTTVGADMQNQTVGFENIHIKGAQSWQIGGNETLSLENAWTVGVDSQTASVGGNQDITINATGMTKVGSESVSIGANLIEQVGDPISGLKGFAESAVLAGVGQIPGVGAALSRGYTWGKALGEGYRRGGWSGLGTAAVRTGLGEVAGRIPGGDAIVAAADSAGLTPWSEQAQQRAAEQQGGGGAAGPGGAGAGAAAAAPGHRKLVVNGTTTEVIGAVHAIQTPGSLKWTTLGASSFAIGGSHATSAVRISRLTMAASADTAAATSLRARAGLGRNVKTAHTLKAGGAIQLDAGAEFAVKASGALSIQAAGAITLDGGTVVFDVGDGASTVSVHGGGLTLESATITINGETQHTGKENAG
ncbi:type VI secretion system tip protein TssI/VgrG [Sorangium sp. So ce367]|uniref:type VI secretion system Vgr family protein n=1 Tax=Sorangium sp. So ce367 TaxID=3133305 RepID=UPI003F63CD41